MMLGLQAVGFGTLFLWLIVLTILYWRMQSGFSGFLRNGDDASILSTVKELLKEQQVDKKDIATLLSRIEKIEATSKTHIQKIGLIRFNPFKDTGGDQSFILALTDGTNSGIVISGLFSRSGTRWYAKRFINGKGSEHELSDEEKKAIQSAR